MNPTKFIPHLIVIIFLGLALPVLGSWVSISVFSEWRLVHEPFHSLIEGLGGFIALTLAGLLLAEKDRKPDEWHHVWMACALIGMGVLDIFHSAVSPGKLFVWLHSSAQFVGGIFFALVWLPKYLTTTSQSARFPIILFVGTVAMGALSIKFPEIVPGMVNQGEFLPLARFLNVLGGLGFLLAASYFIVRFRSHQAWSDYLFAIHCTLFGAAGVLFELSQLWDAAWWWWHFLRLLAYSAGLFYAVSSYLDTVNALKTAQDNLELRIKELQRSNRDLEDFASIASHDMREPLRKIISFVDRIMDTESQITPRGKDYLERIQKSSLRMNRLINDLLNYSQVTSKPGSFERIDLKKIVGQVVVDVDMKISEKNGAVVVEEMPTLEVDQFQMRQLFQNLISNSLKYHREGVPPVVEVKSAKNGNGTWVIRVKDNGIGFEKKYSERIFKIFERLHGRSAPYDGTGIGLAICERIVTRHNGTITTESKVGEGTTFIVTLPEKQPISYWPP